MPVPHTPSPNRHALAAAAPRAPPTPQNPWAVRSRPRCTPRSIHASRRTDAACNRCAPNNPRDSDCSHSSSTSPSCVLAEATEQVRVCIPADKSILSTQKRRPLLRSPCCMRIRRRRGGRAARERQRGLSDGEPAKVDPPIYRLLLVDGARLVWAHEAETPVHGLLVLQVDISITPNCKIRCARCLAGAFLMGLKSGALALKPVQMTRPRRGRTRGRVLVHSPPPNTRNALRYLGLLHRAERDGARY
mmetsp:Transcript_13601/g.34939  ORF Transcript_13601/g.34939 Transcript_13601/m.34939 type:complete len:247 (-) Transcript_13601:33-773(-)